MKPCRHLDYDEVSYSPGCTLRTAEPHYPDVRYWERGPAFTDGGGQVKVQFCKLRGRINGVFQCYNPGELSCYEPEVEV